MQLNQMHLKELCELALEAGSKAVGVITNLAQKDIEAEQKVGGDSLASQVVTEVDRLSQEIILETLRPVIEKFDLGLLTEESEDNHSRFEKDYFWCIDPLDGTLPFTERRPGYSVSIALVSKEGDPVIGVVFDPVERITWYAIKGLGAFKNEHRLSKDDFESIGSELFSLVHDRSFLSQDNRDEIVENLTNKIVNWGYSELKQVYYGGAVINTLRVLENPDSCYFKFPKSKPGGGSIWDFAATACIFREAGGIVSNIYGDPLHLNQKESSFMNHKGVIYCTDPVVWKEIVKLYAKIV